MRDKEFAELTDAEKQHLRTAKYLAEIIKTFDPQSEAPTEIKGRWQNFQKFLESGAGTALITVVLGGIMGSVVSFAFQEFSKWRETYVQRQEKRQETINATFDLIGACFAPAEAAVRFKIDPTEGEPIFDEKTGNFNQWKKDDDEWQKKALKLYDAFEEGQRKWSSEEKKTFLSLSYYFNDNRLVKTGWSELNDSMVKYFQYVAKYCKRGTSGNCEEAVVENQRIDLGNKIDYLGCTLEEASRDVKPDDSKCSKLSLTSTPTPLASISQTPQPLSSTQNTNKK